QQDGAEAQQDPDPDDADRRQRPVKIAEPSPRNPSKPDSPEYLVDQARQGQQPAPDNTGSHEGNDLGQEQNGPGYRAEPPGRHAVYHARDEETESYRDEAEPYHQPERVYDGPEQVGNLEDGHIVLQPDPRCRADPVPAKERVQDAQQEGQQHE